MLYWEGKQLGDYRLIRLIGQGDMGEVYLGEHIPSNNRTAIKVMPGYYFIGDSHEPAHALVRLKHPNIVRVLDFGTENETPFLVMEYAPNGTLRQRHPKGEILPLTTILDYVKQIARALQYAHDQKQINGDIKPEKMLLGQDYKILLSGFDTAVAEEIGDERVLHDGFFDYMAPGQGGWHNTIPASDQYSLGVLVYEWLCGYLPFKGSTLIDMAIQHMKAPPPSLREKLPSIPPAVEEVVMKALAKDPQQRFESVQAFADALERAYLSSIRPKRSDLVGQQFGNYRLTRLLAAGVTSFVYLGEHIQLGTRAAIKVLKDHVDAEEFQNRVRLNVRLVHPHIVRILNFGVKDQILFVVMDFAPNGTLRNRHPPGSRLPLSTVVSYTKQVAAALQYAHDQNLLHGNVHPGNMLIGDNDDILLSGFDSVFADRTEEPFSIGPYIAPERMMSGKLIPASDQYALGAAVYEWLCGDYPFKRNSFEQTVMQLLQTPPPSLREKNPEIPSAVEEVVMKALATDPKQRYASVEAFAYALEQASSPSSVSQAPKYLGQQLGKYQLTKLLGAGGFADVYLGKHTDLNVLAAIKVQHARLTSEDVESFRIEARTIANLRHRNIIRILDFDVEGDIPYLVMDYAPNGTLRDRHPKGSRVPLKTIVSYVKQVAAPLQYAHDQKLIHRDVKPENMLLGPNNEVLLSDFGIAAVAHSTASLKTQAYSGTVHYSAPEQISGKPRLASDQYALGIVVYEWLTGTRPFSGDLPQLMYQHISVPPPPLCEKNPSISPDVEQVVMIALAKDPQRRFKSVQAFATALEQACQQGS